VLQVLEDWCHEVLGTVHNGILLRFVILSRYLRSGAVVRPFEYREKKAPGCEPSR
jgi:hypothetical protein